MEILDKKVLKERLQELFSDETQEEVAARINTTQGNVSKWLKDRNAQVPTLDMLYSIASEYEVSVDWLVGLSDEREVDGVALDKLTYEKVSKILDRLMEYGNLELLNISSLRTPENAQHPASDEEETDQAGELPQQEELPPQYNSDYLIIKDRALSHIFRRRLTMKGMGTDMLGMWKETNVPKYAGIGLLDVTGTAQMIIDTHKWATFTSDADWVDLLSMIDEMTEEERKTYLERRNREKKGNDNG